MKAHTLCSKKTAPLPCYVIEHLLHPRDAWRAIINRQAPPALLTASALLRSQAH
jgi:hypothetical protein